MQPDMDLKPYIDMKLMTPGSACCQASTRVKPHLHAEANGLQSIMKLSAHG